MNMSLDVCAWAEKRGWRAAVLDSEILPAVRGRFDRLAVDGSLDAGFVRGSLNIFSDLEPGPASSGRQALILLAIPRPAHQVGFASRRAIPDLLLPPTYAHYRGTMKAAAAAFRADLGLSPQQIKILNAPLKTLAAAAGLVRFGRNNIGYAAEWGSYFQLAGLMVKGTEAKVQIPADPGDSMLERCARCRICGAACPTGAIGADRWLLRAERCFTLWSESLEPLPAVVPATSPLCVMGCLKCQEVCPENRGRLKIESSGIVFSEEETEAMLGDPDESRVEAWSAIRAKFNELGVSEDARLFARNLRFLAGRGFRVGGESV
jgi:epoxyqueuosine reductase